MKRHTKTIYPNWQSRLLSNARARNKKKYQKQTSITAEDLNKLMQQQRGACYYTRIDFDLSFRNKLTSPSIDRIDNTKPYTLNNIRLVIQFVNIGRNTATEKELVQLISQIKQHVRVSRKLKKPIHEYNVRNHKNEK